MKTFKQFIGEDLDSRIRSGRDYKYDSSGNKRPYIPGPKKIVKMWNWFKDYDYHKSYKVSNIINRYRTKDNQKTNTDLNSYFVGKYILFQAPGNGEGILLVKKVEYEPGVFVDTSKIFFSGDIFLKGKTEIGQQLKPSKSINHSQVRLAAVFNILEKYARPKEQEVTGYL